MDLFGIIGVPLGYLISLVYGLVKNYALSIIIFTIFFRFCILPLSIKQQKITIKNSVFKPYTDEINKKYAKNLAKRQEELQKLNKEYGVNLTAGCLPMILPLIFLFGIVNVVYNPLSHILHIDGRLINRAIEIFKSSPNAVVPNAGAIQFSVIGDVVNFPDRYSELGNGFINSVRGLNLDFFGFNVGDVAKINSITIIFPIVSLVLSFLSIFITYKINFVESAGVESKSFKFMMFLSPIFSCYISLTIPIGVIIYWIVGYVFQIVQIFVLNKICNVEDLRKKYKEEFERIRKGKREKVFKKSSEDGKLVEQTNKDRVAAARKFLSEKYGD